MKIVVKDVDGRREYEGREAENLMFFAKLGSDLFHTVPVMCVQDHKTFREHSLTRVGDSFADMLLKAIVNDDVASWDALVTEHYGGRDGLVALGKELADKLRTAHETAVVANGN